MYHVKKTIFVIYFKANNYSNNAVLELIVLLITRKSLRVDQLLLSAKNILALGMFIGLSFRKQKGFLNISSF